MAVSWELLSWVDDFLAKHPEVERACDFGSGICAAAMLGRCQEVETWATDPGKLDRLMRFYDFHGLPVPAGRVFGAAPLTVGWDFAVVDIGTQDARMKIVPAALRLAPLVVFDDFQWPALEKRVRRNAPPRAVSILPDTRDAFGRFAAIVR